MQRKDKSSQNGVEEQLVGRFASGEGFYLRVEEHEEEFEEEEECEEYCTLHKLRRHRKQDPS